MPAVTLSPIFNAAQLFTASGTPLAGGLINTYTAGTSTPLATYTDTNGTILNANPIVLDAGGYVTSEIWLQTGSTYKFTVTDSAGANARTFDNISGLTANSGPLTATNLTITGNAVLGDAATDTFNAGAGGLVKDSLGNVFTGSGKIGPNATNQHVMPAVTSDTFALLAAVQTLTNKTIDTPAFAGNPSGTVVGGTYTPTFANVVNCSALTVSGVWNYIRVGAVVHVAGALSVTCTAAAGTSTAFTASLPVSSTLTLIGNLAGAGARGNSGTTSLEALNIFAATGTNTAQLNFNCQVAASGFTTVSFQYRVI